ncbi:helix-turn-helix transcriptional regulator [Clavibacter sp. Sh2141]|jgi:hypothetical protein|uniref:helix-turn-helix transcriptional regulator n=1 Tax=Clavibacter sp. Sh2141 TaxID=3395374 RepID=UPI0039BD190D
MSDEYMTPAEVVAATKGTVSVGSLAQRRYNGLPPMFLKPTPRTVLYRRSDVEAWLETSERTSTAATVA